MTIKLPEKPVMRFNQSFLTLDEAHARLSLQRNQGNSEETMTDSISDEYAPSMSELYKIPVNDGLDRADLWMNITEELLRLGVLSMSLRASREFHRHIGSAASIAKAHADEELLWSDKHLAMMKAHLAAMERNLPVIATNDIEIDGDWAE